MKRRKTRISGRSRKKKRRSWIFGRSGKRRKSWKRVLYSIAGLVVLFFAARYFTPDSLQLPWWVSAKLPQQVSIGDWSVPEELLNTLGRADEFLREQAEDGKARWQELTGQSSTMPVPEDGQLTVDFLDVGQGDCALIQVDGHAMLFDCGPEDKGTYIQKYLQEQGVEKLDYVIGSHPDSDHIGGMDVIITKFDCEAVFMPDFEKDSSSLRGVEQALSYRGYEAIVPEPGQVYELGDARFTVLAPIWRYENDSNNNSIAIRLVYGENSFLFTGDAEEEEETDMVANGLTLRADVYQVGHHGSSTASSWRFLTAVQPSYAVISCGEDNDYGHPHAEVLERLRSVGSKIYRTDEQGTVRVTSNGTELTWTTER